MIVFYGPKEGYALSDWEDGAMGGSFRTPNSPSPSLFRFVVTDGATETYAAREWVDLLVGSFMSPGSTSVANGHGVACWPDINRSSLSSWFGAMQKQWWAEAPAANDTIERTKLKQGTMATFVGGQLIGLDTASPQWQAAALGDSVLFHVRNAQLVDQVPLLRSADFDTTPDGVDTRPERLDWMSGELQLREGPLAAGDTIFVATDAFAKWMVTRHEARDKTLWPQLSGLDHPFVFDRIVAAERQAGTMKDDDVTLMRIRLLERPLSTVLLCQ
ncbi:MAG: hypothetical protein ABSB76_32185 [Streptosporangiaceae bacterium]|jgi:hypothetical protein